MCERECVYEKDLEREREREKDWEVGRKLVKEKAREQMREREIIVLVNLSNTAACSRKRRFVRVRIKILPIHSFLSPGGTRNKLYKN